MALHWRRVASARQRVVLHDVQTERGTRRGIHGECGRHPYRHVARLLSKPAAR